MVILYILGLLVYQAESFSLGTDCDCSELQQAVDTAIHNNDDFKACELMNERKFCLKNKEQTDFSCSNMEEKICEIDRDPLYYACDKIPFSCNKSIGVCLNPDLVNKLHGLLPDENCPTIISFLQCESTEQLPGTEFQSLVKSADILCKALNNSIYTQCPDFVTCYKKLFLHDNDLMKIQSYHWWCSQLKKVMTCAGITADYSLASTDTPGCLFHNIKEDDDFCVNIYQSKGSSTTWTTYAVIGCIVIIVLFLVLIIAIVVGILRRNRQSGHGQFFRRSEYYRDIQSVRLHSLNDNRADSRDDSVE